MTSPSKPAMYVQCETENLPKLIKTMRAFSTAHNTSTSSPPHEILTPARVYTPVEQLEPCLAILHLHTVLNMSVEAKRRNLDLKEGDAVE
ncbi:hypothetical protein HBI47_112440 [Parastagonospora nodorum]|nr:hypothetical protein HBI47_112440 [Parastagonospora nodorum]